MPFPFRRHTPPSDPTATPHDDQPRFPLRDRAEAGRYLGIAVRNHLASIDHRPPENLVTLGLPRGGVPVAAEVTHSIGGEFDTFVVRKIGAPDQRELAIGALGMDGTRLINEEIARHLRLSDDEIDQATNLARSELDTLVTDLHEGRPYPALEDRTIVLVDDGLATGATMRVAITAMQRQSPARVIVAIPVGAPNVITSLQDMGVDVVALHITDSLQAVGQWYEDFRAVTLDDVKHLLQSHATRNEPTPNR